MFMISYFFFIKAYNVYAFSILWNTKVFCSDIIVITQCNSILQVCFLLLKKFYLYHVLASFLHFQVKKHEVFFSFIILAISKTKFLLYH